MTDDLKKRLGAYGQLGTRGSDHPHSIVCRDALARITDLEARLAAAEAEVQRIKEINVAHCRTVNTLLVCESRMETRAKAAEAGEDALAECLRRLLKGDSYRAHSEAALTAYEARRKG